MVKFIHLFIYKILLSTYYEPGTVLAGARAMNNDNNKGLLVICSLVGDRKNKINIL